MALSGLTTFTIIKEAAESLEGHKLVGILAVSGGGLAALASAAVGFWRRPARHASGGHGEDHFTEHAMTEHMIHAAAKKTAKSSFANLAKAAGESSHPMTPPHDH